MPVAYASFTLQVHFGLEPATSHREIEALMEAVRRAILDEIEHVGGDVAIDLDMSAGEPDDGWGPLPTPEAAGEEG